MDNRQKIIKKNNKYGNNRARNQSKKTIYE